MSEATHTPGPWTVGFGKSGYPYQIRAERQSDQAPGRVGKAITRWGAISLPSSSEGLANARLIAAAPTLLEALKTILADASCSAFIAQTAEEAIAKAEGK